MNMRRRGFSLIEILSVMVLLAVFGFVTAILLKETLDIERVQAAGFNKFLESTALADQFRADVHRAEATLSEWQDYVANERTLILQTKEGRIVYLWDENRLVRRAFENGGLTEQFPPLSGRETRAEFVRDGREPKMVRLRLHRLRAGEVVEGQTIEIDAALGGDFR